MGFNKKQVDLIVKSEEAHYLGLRSTSLTGPYNELLLLRFLQKTFPSVGFGRGNIVLETEIDGFVKSRRYKQVDIICFRKGREYFKFENFVTVKKPDVYLTIEVKKWCSPKSMNILLKNISNFEKEYSPIKMFGVAFRIWSSKRFNLEKIGRKKGLYIFSHSSTKANEWHKPNHLIRQIKRGMVKMNEIIYKDELERLVNDIREIINVTPIHNIRDKNNLLC